MNLLVTVSYFLHFALVFAIATGLTWISLSSYLLSKQVDKDLNRLFTCCCACLGIFLAVVSVATPTPSGWPSTIDWYIKTRAHDYRATNSCPVCERHCCKTDHHWLGTEGEYNETYAALWSNLSSREETVERRKKEGRVGPEKSSER